MRAVDMQFRVIDLLLDIVYERLLTERTFINSINGTQP